jgi:DNA (cytosine-5)-methyltransferase 1
MTLGFEMAGFDVLATFDNDPVHVSTHKYNFPVAAAVCADVADMTARDVREAAAEGAASYGRDASSIELDCVFGGPSCQGFSEIGRMDGLDPRNDLVFQFARHVKELQPRFFVMENVPGFASPRYAAVVKRLCSQLNRAGYQILDDGPIMLDASGFGVPQVRKRVFLIGAREGEELPHRPVAGTGVVTSLDAIGNLPNADDFEALLEDDEVRLPLSLSRLTEDGEFAKSLRCSSGHLGYVREYDARVLTSSRRTQHSREVRQRLARLKQGEVEEISRLRRLDRSKPSFTLRAGTGRDHGSFTASRPVHFDHGRVITVREAARLHSFPDWFRFHTTKWHGFRQVGNAVPPLLARAVAASVVCAANVSPDRPTDVLKLGDSSWLRYSLMEAAEHLGYDAALLPYDVRRRTAPKL